VPWTGLVASGLPAADALAALPWSRPLTTAFLVALIASLLKAWNSVFMTAVRLLFAQAREGMLPAFFHEVDPRTGAPGKAVIFVAAVNAIGVFFGKGMLEPIVTAMTVCIASIYVLICAATLVMRRRDPDHSGFRVWGGGPIGGLTLVGASGMVVFALLQPAPSTQADAFKWGLLLFWVILGGVIYLKQRRRSVPVIEHENVQVGS
jgi:APA family basic amino acid/polyamine antiporter